MAINMSVAPKPQMSVAVKPKTPAPNMGGLLGKLGSVFSSAPKTTPAPSLSSGLGRPVAPTQSIPAPKPPASLETLRAQNQATRAAAPVNPAVMDVGKPIAPKTPPPAAQQQAVAAAPDQGQNVPDYQASSYQTIPETAANSTPAYPTSTPVDPAKAQLDTLRKSYASTFELSPEEKAASEQLNSISGQSAAEVATQKKEYADRIKAIQDQATLQPFLTGRQMQASGQLADQLSAIKSATEAQTMPLQDKVALLQAQRLAQQDRAKTELGYQTEDIKNAKPIEVGGALVDPTTYEVVYKGGSNAQPTASIQEYQYAVQNGYKGSYVDYQNEDANRKRVAAGGSQDSNRLLTRDELLSYNKPAGTTFADVMGQTPTKALTDVQAKEQAYGTRASEANTYIEKLANSVVGMNPLSYAAQSAAEPNAIGNAFVSDNVRQVRQAERNFLTAILRRESGAVISPTEFKDGEKQYFPRPGDDEGTLAQKAENRQTAISTMLAGVPGNNGSNPSNQTYSSPDGQVYELHSDGLYYPKANSGTGSPVAADAKTIAAAIKKVESNGNYSARGTSGEFGAYQFMPATWKGWAQQYLGNPNAPMTPSNQDKVAEAHISALLAQGKTPEQIALIWNGGQPIRKSGVNSMGVAYNSGAYADKVLRALNG